MRRSRRRTTSATCRDGGPRRWGQRARAGWRAGLVLTAVVLLAGAFGLGLAATCRPAWYAPAAIDYGRLRDDKAALAALEDEISAALNAGQEIRVQLDEAQLNRWLVGRAEIWPGSITTPAGIEQPQIRLHNGQFRLGVIGSVGQWRAVVSVAGTVAVRDDEVTIQFAAARLGAVPIPCGEICERLGGPLANHDRIRRGADGRSVTFSNDWVWPNGKRRCRLREVSIGEGVVEMVLEPIQNPR